MFIRNTRFWLDGLGIRSANRKTGSQPFEAGLSKYWRPPELNIYESEAEQGGTEVRLAAALLWFYVNMLLFRFVAHELLSLSRNRVVHRYGPGSLDSAVGEQVKNEHSAAFPYRYECLNGDQQTVMATVIVERWTHRWKWTPFKRVRDSIWVTFSDQVGPRRGSWKGGCTGCGWELLPGESVVQCLRRMERDRRFER